MLVHSFLFLAAASCFYFAVVLGALLLQGLYSIPLSPRVHLRAVALDLLTDVLLPSSDLKQCILCFCCAIVERSFNN